MASAGPVPAHLGGDLAARAEVPVSLEVCLLGGFSIRLGGESQPDPGLWSVRSLLALLALAGRPALRRAEAAEALWPDSLPSQPVEEFSASCFSAHQLDHCGRVEVDHQRSSCRSLASRSATSPS